MGIMRQKALVTADRLLMPELFVQQNSVIVQTGRVIGQHPQRLLIITFGLLPVAAVVPGEPETV